MEADGNRSSSGDARHVGGDGLADSDAVARRLRKAALFEAILEAQAHGVAVIRDDGRILYGNAALRQMLGQDANPPKSVYAALSRLFPEPEEMAQAAAYFAEDIQSGRGPARTLQIRRVDTAEPRWMQFRVARLADGNILVQAVDVTETHRVEQARAELEEQLLQAQKMEAVGTLAGGIAHDMNNVLGVIMGFASVLQQSQPSESARARCVHGILSAARRGRDLTDNLLGFARKGTFTREVVPLERLVREVGNLLRRTIPKSVRLAIELSPETLPVYVDASQVSHAIMNLCLNAVDAMPEGGVLRLRTRALDMTLDEVASWVSVAPGRYAELRVEDSGAGMDRRTLRHAFEPFFTTKPKGQGTGLGLSMVYGTVMNHKGDIQIESAPGKGTRVTVLLPLASEAEHEQRSRPRPSDPAVSTPARVLVVDDEHLMLQAAKVLLRSLGHEVVHLSARGADAVRFLEENPGAADVVILDLIMPGMDGAETFDALRALQPNLPVLLCSGYPQGNHASELLARGAAGFLRKPFERDALAEAIQQAVGARGGRTS